jgi:hypothetical protein
MWGPGGAPIQQACRAEAWWACEVGAQSSGPVSLGIGGLWGRDGGVELDLWGGGLAE